MQRMKKSALNTFIYYIVMILCYAPLFISMLILSISPNNWTNTWGLVDTLAFMNSSINPFLYCWRLRELRTAVLKTTRNIFCKQTVVHSFLNILWYNDSVSNHSYITLKKVKSQFGHPEKFNHNFQVRPLYSVTISAILTIYPSLFLSSTAFYYLIGVFMGLLVCLFFISTNH